MQKFPNLPSLKKLCYAESVPNFILAPALYTPARSAAYLYQKGRHTMSDSTSNSVFFPLDPSLDDKRPLPEIVAEHYSFPRAYVDHEDGKRCYAVQDWIAGVAQAADASKFWDAMKRRLRKADIELSLSCKKMPTVQQTTNTIIWTMPMLRHCTA